MRRITPREKEILNLIAKEYTGKEIANELYISAETVKTHRANLLTKLQAKNTAGLIVKSIQHNIIQFY